MATTFFEIGEVKNYCPKLTAQNEYEMNKTSTVNISFMLGAQVKLLS